MKRDHVYRLLGVALILLPLIAFIVLDVSDLESFLYGFLIGVGLTIFSNGEETKIFGKYIFKRKNAT